jgi:hypothetical protein
MVSGMNGDALIELRATPAVSLGIGRVAAPVVAAA